MSAETIQTRTRYQIASPDAVHHSRELPGGSIDDITDSRIIGWCVDPLTAHKPVQLELRVLDTVLAEFTTDVARDDIARCFGVETKCGFAFEFSDLPHELASKALKRLGDTLYHSPQETVDLSVTVKERAVELPRWVGAGSSFLNASLLVLLRASHGPEEIGWFDAQWYTAENPIVRRLGTDPYQHYCNRGWREGRPPNRVIATKLGRIGIKPHNAVAGSHAQVAALIAESGLFDPAWYSERYGVPEHEAILHYVSKGAFLGYDPNPFFSSLDYLKEHLESAKAGHNPLAHLIRGESDEDGSGSTMLSDLRLTARDWLKGL